MCKHCTHREPISSGFCRFSCANNWTKKMDFDCTPFYRNDEIHRNNSPSAAVITNEVAIGPAPAAVLAATSILY